MCPQYVPAAAFFSLKFFLLKQHKAGIPSPRQGGNTGF